MVSEMHHGAETTYALMRVKNERDLKKLMAAKSVTLAIDE